ncbi:hypothetical protein V7990_004349 [Salmonella enterica]|nr:hypothetical protein [Salmonella enterica]
MEFGHTRAGQERSRRYRPEDEENWLAQTPLNHAVYLTAEHAGNGSIRYQRDALGNPTDITLPDGQHLTHLYYGSGHQGKIIKSMFFVLINSHFLSKN